MPPFLLDLPISMQADRSHQKAHRKTQNPKSLFQSPHPLPIPSLFLYSFGSKFPRKFVYFVSLSPSPLNSLQWGFVSNMPVKLLFFLSPVTSMWPNPVGVLSPHLDWNVLSLLPLETFLSPSFWDTSVSGYPFSDFFVLPPVGKKNPFADSSSTTYSETLD